MFPPFPRGPPQSDPFASSNQAIGPFQLGREASHYDLTTTSFNLQPVSPSPGQRVPERRPDEGKHNSELYCHSSHNVPPPTASSAEERRCLCFLTIKTDDRNHKFTSFSKRRAGCVYLVFSHTLHVFSASHKHRNDLGPLATRSHAERENPAASQTTLQTSLL